MSNTSRGFVLITGSSTGIGRVAAEHLASIGYHVLAGVRRPGDAPTGERLTPLVIDVTESASIKTAAEQIGQITGSDGLKGLINNAGIGIVGPVEFVTLDKWRRQFEVNVFGQIAVTQAMLPLMRQHIAAHGHGAARIVLISSIAGLIGQPILGPYSASKHALESIGDSLRMELREQGIHVSLIEPGAIRSEIWRKGKEQSEAIPKDDPARLTYGSSIDGVEKAVMKSAANAVPAMRVARVIETCLTRSTPPARRRIGRDATMAAIFHSILPTRWFDGILRHAFGI